MFQKSLLFFLVCIASTTLLANHQAVVTAHPLATQAGMAVLKKGGNAFDAAIAVASTLTVVEPYHSGIGGGGFWLCRQADGKTFVIDGREVAPLSAHSKMYLGDNQKAIQALSKSGGLSAAIPGEVASWAYLNQKGRLPLKDALAFAIEAAKQGFEVDDKFASFLQLRRQTLEKFPSTQKAFFKDGQPLQKGDALVQLELAQLLEVLAKEGTEAFYKGPIAEKMVSFVQKNGGIWHIDDLNKYEVKIREPIRSEYQGMKITTVGPPSAGGIAVLNALQILDEYEMEPLSVADKAHLVIESLRRSFCDRAKYIGDPDATDVPVKMLLSQKHANEWQDSIDINKATKSQSLSCGQTETKEGETTHYVIKDKEGNIISATTTINFPFGSGMVVEGLGFVLNNEMDDFATDVGGFNGFGLINTSINSVQPGKRPVSSMTPVIFETDDGIGALGTPGGSRIPSMVLLSILESKHSNDPNDWVKKPRYHQQYLPDLVLFEKEAFDKETQQALMLRGHKLLNAGWEYGNMQALYIDKKTQKIKAASDPRGIGEAQVE